MPVGNAQGIQIVLDQTAKEFLVERGFDPTYGARPLRRVIQRFVEDPLAEVRNWIDMLVLPTKAKRH